MIIEAGPDIEVVCPHCEPGGLESSNTTVFYPNNPGTKIRQRSKCRKKIPYDVIQMVKKEQKNFKHLFLVNFPFLNNVIMNPLHGTSSFVQ